MVYFVGKLLLIQQILYFMPSMSQKKYLIYLLFISFVATVSCESLSVVPNESDYYADAMTAKGNQVAVDDISLTQRIANLVGNSDDIDLDQSITFEVALNQFSIMPLLSVDRVGGVIITDWFSTSSNINERVKFNIIIKDEKMLAESLDIIMFKEVLNESMWKQVLPNSNTTVKIKEVILEKARRLKATAQLS